MNNEETASVGSNQNGSSPYASSPDPLPEYGADEFDQERGEGYRSDDEHDGVGGNELGKLKPESYRKAKRKGKTQQQRY